MPAIRTITLDPIDGHPLLGDGPPPPRAHVFLYLYETGAVDCRFTVNGLRYADSGDFYGLYFFYAPDVDVQPVGAPEVFNVSQYSEGNSSWVFAPAFFQSEPVVTAAIIRERNDGTWYDPATDASHVVFKGTSFE